MKKFIVITSIFSPTEAVKKFAKLKDWQLIIVGDKKTPKDWKLHNAIYISPDAQIELFPKMAKDLPWNSYSRKNIGYLYAMRQGADIIVDTDDDNIPYDDWGKGVSFEGTFKTIESKGFVNIYKYFTDEFIWPRGYPLNKVLEKKKDKIEVKKQKIGVWQFLADREPDVDAIYRLTINKQITFDKNPPIVLGKNTICPVNTQNTFFTKALFPLLFLPPFVSIRFVDILKGFVAQPLMWELGYHTAFGSASVMQKRNPHDYMEDFELEVPMYLNTEKTILATKRAINPKQSLSNNLVNVYKQLYHEGIVPQETVAALKTWIKEIS